MGMSELRGASPTLMNLTILSNSFKFYQDMVRATQLERESDDEARAELCQGNYNGANDMGSFLMLL